MAIPIMGQYEQQCNAAAMQKLGVYILSKIDESFKAHFYKWINNTSPTKLDYSQSIPEALTYLFEQYESQPSSEQFSLATLDMNYDPAAHFTY